MHNKNFANESIILCTIVKLAKISSYKCMHSTGSNFAMGTTGTTIWPDLLKMESLNKSSHGGRQLIEAMLAGKHKSIVYKITIGFMLKELLECIVVYKYNYK